jgi:hypothetical protein
MDLDSIFLVDNLSDLTLQTLVDRIARSTTDEQFIYRETELDELWRLADMAVRTATTDGHRNQAQLEAMRAAIHRAHDLVGMDGKPIEAAEALRQTLA